MVFRLHANRSVRGNNISFCSRYNVSLEDVSHAIIYSDAFANHFSNNRPVS